MKFLIPVIAFLSLSISCFSQSSEVIYIWQGSNGGISKNVFLISENLKNVNDLRKRDKSIDWLAQSSVVSSDAFNLLKQFIIKNCNHTDSSNEYTKDLILIRIYSKQKFPKCYIIGKIQIKKYFNNLIEKSNRLSDPKGRQAIDSLCKSVLKIVDYDPKNHMKK